MRQKELEPTAATQPLLQVECIYIDVRTAEAYDEFLRNTKEQGAAMSDQVRREKPDEIRTIRSMLKTAGIRATPARISVLRELRASRSPLTHADLTEILVPEGFDKATVFRNLNDLAEAGLASRTELGDHVWRFEAVDPAHAGEEKHPHFVCVECKSVTCLGDMEFTTKSRKQASTIGNITEILIKGHCSACASAVP
ncbi:Ferric uptake regulation protein [Caulifigura coniformis]|uniref:Ferric uptake regulation protein n=1 Tax=Caulifigura coniformis TaxID=2527983 RepID=A0A517SD35_9PLAN|nr:transcriptional repressor [Caulifigura coniformis]QDT54042.1 Ferric uptake regulation protein [Caulifigura coniformis]